MRAGEYGGRFPPPFESWVNGTEQQTLWRARLAGGAGSWNISLSFWPEEPGNWVSAVQKAWENVHFLFFLLFVLLSEGPCGQLELLRESRPLGQRLGTVLERGELEGDPFGAWNGQGQAHSELHVGQIDGKPPWSKNLENWDDTWNYRPQRMRQNLLSEANQIGCLIKWNKQNHNVLQSIFNRTQSLNNFLFRMLFYIQSFTVYQENVTNSWGKRQLTNANPIDDSDHGILSQTLKQS